VFTVRKRHKTVRVLHRSVTGIGHVREYKAYNTQLDRTDENGMKFVFVCKTIKMRTIWIDCFKKNSYLSVLDKRHSP